MINAANCTHNYQPMVSHGDRHWQKCTKCYKVIESVFALKGLQNGELEITGLIDENVDNLIIPSHIDGSPITSIGEYAFANASFKQIDISASIASIGIGAFKNCTLLEKVVIRNNDLESISPEAFYGCSSLMYIDLPAKLNSIGESAFINCASLTKFTFRPV